MRFASLLHGRAELSVAFKGSHEGRLVEAGACDCRCLGSVVHSDTIDAVNFFECRLHSRGAPPASCHAGDCEGHGRGVAHLVDLTRVLAGSERDAAQPQEEEKELFHNGFVLGLSRTSAAMGPLSPDAPSTGRGKLVISFRKGAKASREGGAHEIQAASRTRLWLRLGASFKTWASHPIRRDPCKHPKTSGDHHGPHPHAHPARPRR